jgi:hypothetical protein
MEQQPLDSSMQNRNESNPGADAITTRSAGIRYGVIAAVIGIVYFVALTTMGVDINQGVWSWFRYVITIAIIVLAHKYYKDNTNGFMSYGQGVSISMWIGLVSAVIGSVFTYIYVKFIDTAFIETMKQKQMEAMEEKGMSEDQIDQAMQIAGMFMTPEAIFALGLVFGFLGTLVVGLIVSIFTQKKAPETAF